MLLVAQQAAIRKPIQVADSYSKPIRQFVSCADFRELPGGGNIDGAHRWLAGEPVLHAQFVLSAGPKESRIPPDKCRDFSVPWTRGPKGMLHYPYS
jgi:hypothetical protein